ncbi:peptide chain release factor N(5)-glutamine methyltransferase [bacterium]|nr:MAG: peptide chain release factor N(5)-glutamine methyltransferase [bacterium]
MTEKEILLTSILDCSLASLYAERISLNPGQSEKFSQALSLRAKGLPLQYILGEAEFFGLKFKVDSRVFIPRPETEILVETVIKQSPDLGLQSAVEILELGTGSGCVAVSLAKFLPQAKITAVDISSDALSAAKENALLNGTEERINFVQSNLFSSPELSGRSYGLIVSNPPYIPEDDIKGLQREISYEPRIALDGGSDGLDFYRRIIAEAAQFLNNDGLLIMEIGYKQLPEIKNIFDKTGSFEIIRVVKDYNNIDRVIIGQLKAKKYG